MINVLVSGCNGRMGKQVVKEIDNYPDLILTCGFDHSDKRF